MFFSVVNIIAVVITLASLYYPIKSIISAYEVRNIKKLVGVSKKDTILVVCSELEDPTDRQLVEEREFIYLMKYGDLDAWVEYQLSTQRLFPKVNINVQSSGESQNNNMELSDNICLIGGPDYNKLTEHFINAGHTRFSYTIIDGEIAILDKVTNKHYYYTTLDKDYGYIEKIRNPYNPKKFVLIFGGCHTVGVTSAVKFFSAYSNGNSKTSKIAITNAKELVENKNIDNDNFSFLIDSTKVGATISYPKFSDIIELK